MWRRGGLMVSALVPGSSGPASSPERGHCVVFLGKTLYSHSATQELRGVTYDGLASRPGGVEILLAASCYGNRDKLRPDEPVLAQRLHFQNQMSCQNRLYYSTSWRLQHERRSRLIQEFLSR